MIQVTIVGGVVIITLALLASPSSTITLVTTIVSIRGFSWIMKKVTQNINKESSEIINFAGWSLAGISIVKLLGLSLKGIQPVIDTCNKIGESVTSISDWLTNAEQFIEKVGTLGGLLK